MIIERHVPKSTGQHPAAILPQQGDAGGAAGRLAVREDLRRLQHRRIRRGPGQPQGVKVAGAGVAAYVGRQIGVQPPLPGLKGQRLAGRHPGVKLHRQQGAQLLFLPLQNALAVDAGVHRPQLGFLRKIEQGVKRAGRAVPLFHQRGGGVHLPSAGGPDPIVKGGAARQQVAGDLGQLLFGQRVPRLGGRRRAVLLAGEIAKVEFAALGAGKVNEDRGLRRGLTGHGIPNRRAGCGGPAGPAGAARQRPAAAQQRRRQQANGQRNAAFGRAGFAAVCSFGHARCPLSGSDFL